MKKLLLTVLFFLSFAVMGFDYDDFVEENIVKADRFYNFNELGFGYYDEGEETLKAFDWNFQKIFSIPMKKGQGPGQLKDGNSPFDVTFNEKYIFCALTFEKKINVFNKNGKFISEIKCNFMPKMMEINGDLLTIFNGDINFEKEENDFKIDYNLKTKKFSEISKIKGLMREKSQLSKDLGDVHVSGINSDIGFCKSGEIFILDRQNGILFLVNKTGKITKKMTFPAKDKFEMQKEKKGNSVMIMLKAVTYISTIVNNGNSFVFVIGYNVNDEEKATSEICRMTMDGKVNKQKLKGRWTVLGIKKGKVLIFDRYEYVIKEIEI